MNHSPRVLALLVVLFYAGNSFAIFNEASTRQSRPHLPLTLQQRNLSTLPDPFEYRGAHGLYRLSSYTEPSVQVLYVDSLIFACLADLFDAIANKNFRAHQAYPDGHYKCSYSYTFPPTIVFLMELVKVDAPNWDFTFSDMADDLRAIFNAFQHFSSPTYGVPQMHIDVFRYRNGQGGPTFLASTGKFMTGHPIGTNVSVA